jgi:hypothetical protein
MITIPTIYGRKHITRERAVVLDTRDPDMLGRIMVVSPTLGETGWILYAMAPGVYDPPKAGDTVYVEAENGDTAYAVAHGKIINPLYDKSEYGLSLFREVPTVMAFISNGSIGSNGKPLNSFGENGFTGNAILLDDGLQNYGVAGVPGNQYAGIKIMSYGGAKVLLSDEGGNQKILIADFNNGSTPLELDTETGNRFLINSETDEITMQDVNDNYVILAPSGITINSTDGQVDIEGGTQIELQAPKVIITTTGDTDVNAGGAFNVSATGNADISGAMVNLSSAGGSGVDVLASQVKIFNATGSLGVSMQLLLTALTAFMTACASDGIDPVVMAAATAFLSASATAIADIEALLA